MLNNPVRKFTTLSSKHLQALQTTLIILFTVRCEITITVILLHCSTVHAAHLFLRYENGSTCFHEDDRDGLVKVCRLVINARYEEYATEGYVVLNTRQPVIYQSASCRPGLGQHLCSQVRWVGHTSFKKGVCKYFIGIHLKSRL